MRWRTLLSLTVWGMSLFQATSRGLGEEQFSTLITLKTGETFVAVQNFLKTAPESEREASCRWLFRTATEFGWEAQVLDEAISYANSPDADPSLKALAEQVRLIGMAQTAGRQEEAVAAFSTVLRQFRLRSPQLGSDLGQGVAMQFQLAGDQGAARAVYERLSGAFFLNGEVKDWCDRRTRRLELLGKPAPAVTGTTFAGEAFEGAVLSGKVYLVDFWATNCRPCLEELPKLREIYAEYHPRGLEIVGISFDENEAALKEFQERQPLPWTIIRNDRLTPERFQVELIPCLVLVDSAGNVAATDVSVSHLRGAVRKLLDHHP
ncbi:MAG: TlpA disulfide reductase family protein [Planctomycetaceae bacterium]